MPDIQELSPLTVRMRQERLYTLCVAQELAEHQRYLRPEEAVQLNRYARWHFGKSFDVMVAECEEMIAHAEKECARVVGVRSGAGGASPAASSHAP